MTISIARLPDRSANLLTAFLAVVGIAVIVRGSAAGALPRIGTAVVGQPLVDLFLRAIEINVLLAVFNIIPLPPLDGAQVLRHFLSYDALQKFDQYGYVALMIVVFVLPMIGFNLVGILSVPFTIFFQMLLALFLGFR